MNEENKKTELTSEEKLLFEKLMPEDVNEILTQGIQRRHFLKLAGLTGGGIMLSSLVGNDPLFAQTSAGSAVPEMNTDNLENVVQVSLRVNGKIKKIAVDSRMTLLDTLRERLGLTGTKKGCDHGQCGACTVIVDGRRVLSCLTLAATCEGKAVKTIEGLAIRKDLHPMQAAFIKHDGFQCGFCTPGQICSAVALVNEAKAGEASYVTENIRNNTGPLQLSDEEIKERMSGNICRCGAYPNIVAAIKEVQSGKKVQ